MRYRNGKANRAERFIVDTWYRSLDKPHPHTPGLENPEREQETADRIFQRIGQTTRLAERSRKLRPWKWAAAAMIASLALVFLYPHGRYQTDTIATVYKAPQGKIARVTLPDSSIVWLTAGSTLRRTENYGKKTRSVELIDGEACFSVRKNPHIPFIVRADGTETTVLGTQFIISAYNGLPELSIQVAQGNVAVAMPDGKYGSLLAGESVVLDKIHAKSRRERFGRASFDPGTEHIFFSDASFDELAVRIQRMFGYRLIAGSPEVASGRYTGEFTPDDSITDIVERLTWLHRGSFTIRGKEVIMK